MGYGVESGMGYGMGGAGMLLVTVLSIVAVVALLKYLRS